MPSMMVHCEYVRRYGFIRLFNWAGKLRAASLADGQVMRSLIGKASITEDDYDTLLMKAGEFGVGIEVVEDEE